MTLTFAEEERLTNAEEITQQLKHLIDGAGSKNQLNRLLVLCNEEVRKLTARVATLETQVQELLALARKLQ
jgi:polyhydroxyalkanoate synthesis regulator phasin